MTKAVLFDIDGTLADATHRLHHIQNGSRNWDAFFAECVNDPVIEPIRDLAVLVARQGYKIILVSGRSDAVQQETKEWLGRSGVPYSELHMRRAGDYRQDFVIKSELLDHILAQGNEIAFVVDDRPSVVAMWRECGLTCLQCRDWEEAPPVEPGLLTLMIGTSGAGKSHWLASPDAIKYGIHTSHVISSDQFRADLCGDFRDQTKNDDVFAAVHAVAKARLVHGLPTTIDATHLRRKDRMAAAALAKGGRVRYLLVDRPEDEKRRDAGWRAQLPFDLIAKHEQTLRSQLKDILAGDRQPNVEVVDMREGGMTGPVHPARAMAFDELWNGLQRAVAEKRVKENLGANGLRLYCYAESTVYDRAWDEFTMLARGVILDPVEKRVVATPFPKFFNVGERLDSIPDLPFETFEKLDGSLIILFHHNGEWRTATKGSLNSEQSRWAAKWIAGYDLGVLDTKTTYLAEAIYPENRIVVHYRHAGLVLLSAYRGDGTEVGYDELGAVADRLGWRIAIRHSFSSVSELLALAQTLPATEEGFVLRFSNGLRLKVKGDEYCRIHRLVSHLTPLAMWDAMRCGDDLQVIRRQLPEEFWADFDAITGILYRQVDELIAEVKAEAKAVSHMTDKEVGLRLDTFPERVRRFIFTHRKTGGDLLNGRAREQVFRTIRPDANRLDGYTPSYAINRVLEEAA